MWRLMSSAAEIRPFRVDMPDEAIADARRRAPIQDAARYGTTDYDWRACEASLNALPQFTTEIDGQHVYFFHVKSRHENALPLIITHGWPGSILEMLGVVGPLTDPAAHGGSAGGALDLAGPATTARGLS